MTEMDVAFLVAIVTIATFSALWTVALWVYLFVREVRRQLRH